MMYLLNGLPAFFGAINITGNIIISGQGLFANGTAAAPSISFASAPTNGIYYAGGNEVGISNNGILRWKSTYASATNHRFQANGGGYLDATSNGAIGLTAAGTNQNITLTPSGTEGVEAVLASAPATQYQTTSLRVKVSTNRYVGMGYDNTTGSGFGWIQAAHTGVAFTPLVLQGAGSNVLIGTGTDSGNGRLQLANHTTAAGGIGLGTDFGFYRQTTNQITIGHAGQEIVSFYKVGAGMKLEVNGGTVASPQITANGDSDTGIYWALGNDLRLVTGGLSALILDASQNATFAASVNVLNTAAIRWTSWTQMLSPADGVIRLTNAAGSDFTRLQFGGTTVGFPSLKRSGANLIVRSADDAQDAAILAYCHVSTNVAIAAAAGAVSYGGTTATTVGAAGGASLLPATPLGYIIVNVGGTSAKIPYYNA